jgi:hypothetical protein
VDTDSLGEFDFTIPIDISALLGTRNFTIQVPENGAQITSEIAVISGTTLRITAVEEAALGDEVIFSFTVVDDADRTVSGVSILIEGLAEPVTTDDLGAAVATLVVPVDTIAPLWRVSAETVATEQYLASEASYSVAIQKALAMWVYIVFAVVGLVGTAGGAAGFWLWRKMRPTTVTEVVQVIAQTNDVIVVEQDVDNSDPVVQTESVKSAVPDQEEIPVFETSLLSIDLVNDNEEFPEIIGIGEVISLRIVLDNTENTFIVGATVSITVGGHGEFSEVTGDSGLISLDLEAIATGDHVVKVSFEGSDDYLASTANTRIWVIDYREAITDVYNRLVARVRASGLELNSQATPREIERRVVTQIPGVDEVVLDRLVSVFEEADYSLHDISRSDFLKAHVALQSLSAFFDQLREQAALLEERSSGELDRDAGIEDEIENISPSSDDSEVEDEETERGKDADDEGSIGS